MTTHPLYEMCRMLTVKEAASILNIHKSTIRNWIKKGFIKSKKSGVFDLISKEEVNRIKKLLSEEDKWILSRRRMQSSPIPYLYKLCVEEKYIELREELGLDTPPRNLKECYTLVNRLSASNSSR